MEIKTEHLAAIADIVTPLQAKLAPFLNRLGPQYGVDSPRVWAHFLAQACFETAYFRTLEEYASGDAYEGRKDLGNIHPGDGRKFKGRGIFQTTGYVNYQRFGIKLGTPDLFLIHPEYLLEPQYAVLSACIYWSDNGLTHYAEKSDDESIMIKGKPMSPVEYISYRINGGWNGLEGRKKCYERAKKALNME